MSTVFIYLAKESRPHRKGKHTQDSGMANRPFPPRSTSPQGGNQLQTHHSNNQWRVPMLVQYTHFFINLLTTVACGWEGEEKSRIHFFSYTVQWGTFTESA
ncbi:hypothetical protein GDO81_013524 [Engystomops pustulosus]|uniref:Uncharacterized protein n=1 Tax=Engystomops pustulosus TaxID=76066 RepID=A0AAV7B3I7_ENGPU|nr:hypothetical protein GDO81_013524 [Engystomops pustulosus]